MAVAGIVVVFASAYATYGWLASVPRFLLDELYYLEAGTSLGSGDGLRFRDESWGYGPVFPALISLVVRLTSSQETTYDVVKLLGALAFAGALAPVFLLARRVVGPWWAVGVTAATAILPATTYVSLVMTESITFLVVTWTILLMTVVLERPSLGGQVGVLALVALAVGARTQMLLLAAAWPLAVLLAELVPRHRSPAAALRRWWPSVAGLALGGVAALVLLATRSERGALGAYDVLARRVSPIELGAALVHQVGDVALTLAVIPLVGAVITLVRWWPDVRAGERRRTAVAVTFVSLNALLLAVVSVFASSEYAVGSLHDRNLFYVYPLWLVLFARWLEDGIPRVTAAVVAVSAVVLTAFVLLPFDEIAAEDWLGQHEAPGTEIWGIVGRVGIPLSIPMPLFAVAFLAAAVWLPPRFRLVLPGLVLVVLAANTAWAWRSGLIDPAANGAAPRGERRWVDEAIGDEARAVLVLPAPACAPLDDASGTMTLFFNRAAVDSIGLGAPGIARGREATFDAAGAVIVRGKGPLAARYVVTTPSLELKGRRLATGSPAGLVLWETDGGVVRRAGPGDVQSLEALCSRAAG